MPRIVRRERRRRDVVAPAPDLHLRFTVPRGRLGFVQSLERAVVALVQAPALFLANPHRVHRVERNPQRSNRALQDRGVGDVENVPAFRHQPPRLGRLLAAAVGQIDVGPPGEPVLLVPGALAVTKKNEVMHGPSSPAQRTRRTPRPQSCPYLDSPCPRCPPWWRDYARAARIWLRPA